MTQTIDIFPSQTLQNYKRIVRAIPMLTQDEETKFSSIWKKERDLIISMKGIDAKDNIKNYSDQAREALNRLVASHLKLVVKIAFGFRGYQLSLMDIISEGNLGLLQAVRAFDPTKGFRLATYAIHWIKSTIHEYIIKSWSMVKIGTTTAQKKLFFNLRKLKNNLLSKRDNNHNFELTPSEVEYIASNLNVKKEEVISMNSRLFQTVASLNDQIQTEDGNPIEKQNLIASDSINQENLVISHDEEQNKQHMFNKAFEQSLLERERFVIKNRYLISPIKTLEVLSNEMGISRERVRQIESKAIKKMRHWINNNS